MRKTGIFIWIGLDDPFINGYSQIRDAAWGQLSLQAAVGWDAQFRAFLVFDN